MYRFLHTTLRSAQVRRNDEASDHQRPPLADEAKPCLSTDKPVCRTGRGIRESLSEWQICVLAHNIKTPISY